MCSAFSGVMEVVLTYHRGMLDSEHMVGSDVITQAQSDTGKNATFSISVLQKLDPNVKACQALILAPIREPAQQIQKSLVAIGEFMNVECHACIGGTSVRVDMMALQEGHR